MNYECIEHEGLVVIADEWQPNSVMPIMERNYWPTGLPVTDWQEIVGRHAEGFAPGIFRIVPSVGVPVFIELIGGAQAKSCYIESKPIRKPRWGKSYAYGKWKRY